MALESCPEVHVPGVAVFLGPLVRLRVVEAALCPCIKYDVFSVLSTHQFVGC